LAKQKNHRQKSHLKKKTDSLSTKALFGSLELRGGEGRALEGGKYRGKLRNLSHVLKEKFYLE